MRPRVALCRRCRVAQRLLRGVLGGFLFLTVGGCGQAVSPEQQQAITKIQDLGGRVNFKHGGYEVDLKGTPVEDPDLECLKHIAKLKNLDLEGTRVTDKAIPHLRAIASLEIVMLQRTQISADGREALKKALPAADVRP